MIVVVTVVVGLVSVDDAVVEDSKVLFVEL